MLKNMRLLHFNVLIFLKLYLHFDPKLAGFGLKTFTGSASESFNSSFSNFTVYFQIASAAKKPSSFPRAIQQSSVFFHLPVYCTSRLLSVNFPPSFLSPRHFCCLSHAVPYEVKHTQAAHGVAGCSWVGWGVGGGG